MKKIIEVSQKKDIQPGVKGSAEKCMVARALRRQLNLKKGLRVEVGPSEFEIVDSFGTVLHLQTLPKFVQKKISTFDSARPKRLLKGFKFTARVDSSLVRKTK